MDEIKTITAPRIVTIRQGAKLGPLPEHALRTLIKNGTIRAIPVGNRQMFNYDKFIAWLNEQ
ncbi:MAG: hypothetical protein KBS74_07605 [Clostridiales bacterium]|nr:hypothetical protein [Candidatus Cacconaster stercorequi]